MTYEKDIPDYAMLPAKETEEHLIIPVTKGAIYSPIQVTDITEKPKTTITIEEDILVPDTKPDLREILLIDGKVRLANREIEQVNKGDDNVTVSGEVGLTTLYLPEKKEGCEPIISVQSRVPFTDQWHTGFAPGGTLVMNCKVEKIDYMVINERKYRVKIVLAIYARRYMDSKVDIFEGISDQQIQMLKEKVEITNVALRKKDSLSIKEDLEIKEDWKVESILKQDISIVENYRQATSEKVVINGFILVNLLLKVSGREGAEDTDDNLQQMQEKVEFTQFIPVQQTGQWSGSSSVFDGSDLKVKPSHDEEGREVLNLEGELVTYIELFRNIEKEIIVDAYHREKDFICDFREEESRTLIGSTVGESSLREIISLETIHGDVEKILYTTGEVLSGESHGEPGKVITEGTILAKIICRGQTEKGTDEMPPIFSLREEMPFRVVTTVPQIMGNEIIEEKISIKDLWAEKINGKQIELNVTVMVSAELMRPLPFKVLENPAFEESSAKKETPRMVVYIAGPDDTLWSIAKKFKTTTESIERINNLDGSQITQGQKLLLLR